MVGRNFLWTPSFLNRLATDVSQLHGFNTVVSEDVHMNRVVTSEMPSVVNEGSLNVSTDPEEQLESLSVDVPSPYFLKSSVSLGDSTTLSTGVHTGVSLSFGGGSEGYSEESAESTISSGGLSETLGGSYSESIMSLGGGYEETSLSADGVYGESSSALGSSISESLSGGYSESSISFSGGNGHSASASAEVELALSEPEDAISEVYLPLSEPEDVTVSYSHHFLGTGDPGETSTASASYSLSESSESVDYSVSASEEASSEVYLPLSEPEENVAVYLPLSEPEESAAVYLPLSEPEESAAVYLPLSEPSEDAASYSYSYKDESADTSTTSFSETAAVEDCLSCIPPEPTTFTEVVEYKGASPKYVSVPEQTVLVNVAKTSVTSDASDEPILITVPSPDIKLIPSAANLDLSYSTDSITETITLPGITVAAPLVDVELDDVTTEVVTVPQEEVHVEYSAPKLSVSSYDEAVRVDIPTAPIYVSVPVPSVFLDGTAEPVSYTAPARPITVSLEKPNYSLEDVDTVSKTVPAPEISVTVEQPTVVLEEPESFEFELPERAVYVQVPEVKVTLSDPPEPVEKNVSLPPVDVYVPAQEVYVQVPEGPVSFDVTPQPVHFSVPDYPVSVETYDAQSLEIPAASVDIEVLPPDLELLYPTEETNLQFPTMPVHITQSKINVSVDESTPLTSVEVPRQYVTVNVAKPEVSYFMPENAVEVKLIKGFPAQLCGFGEEHPDIGGEFQICEDLLRAGDYELDSNSLPYEISLDVITGYEEDAIDVASFV
mmetsp:Transcript_17680/g.30436  ORF Transcript_17680/g.30436 Transcript_17680/m.30436 type:complete len:779 (+) Transcript_17680:21-2357(+)|eukprot:CAMPEP_0196657312 /NCGR_PEP_ID=MMETSP1086-20130531/22567_1 /TAXON_ID=77921 /ORGANISM="Cyanoptyche  gloeocystis , Strain SAG4.97" /LENGTH=778 /DNA_ID=CAMNT_0041990379 /DNA_START=21 /DNA_END=2357 /DNA_ORIENTATION=-